MSELDVLCSQLKGKALWAGMAKMERMKAVFLGNQTGDKSHLKRRAGSRAHPVCRLPEMSVMSKNIQYRRYIYICQVSCLVLFISAAYNGQDHILVCACPVTFFYKYNNDSSAVCH